MSTARSDLSHEERTASEPRDPDLHRVRIDRIKDVNSTIKLIKLSLEQNKKDMFRPGQWLDVFIPGLPKAGGFTITSDPARTSPKPPQAGFLELAIQKSPSNPPAAWLWQPEDEIRGTKLNVRVGGSFVWPPPKPSLDDIDRVVFIAGGVGINPLMSMVSDMQTKDQMPASVHFLYATKVSQNERVLFLDRLLAATLSTAQSLALDHVAREFRLKLFLTGQRSIEQLNDGDRKPLQGLIERNTTDVAFRRMTVEDALAALGPPEKRTKTVCYVCGPAGMTDEYVDFLQQQPGLGKDQVFCERWW